MSAFQIKLDKRNQSSVGFYVCVFDRGWLEGRHHEPHGDFGIFGTLVSCFPH